MIIDFIKEYPELYESVRDIPRRKLKVLPSEDRGDDCGSSLLPEYEDTTLTLFLTSQKIAYNGFVENYCLDSEVTEKIRDIRKKVDNNPVLRESIYNILSQYLPISLEAFQQLVLGEQLMIIDEINNSEDNKNDLEERIEQLLKNKNKEKLLKK